jgi:mRNA interferase HigB
MHVISLRHLKDASEQYPDAAREIQAWYKIVKDARWRNFEELRRTFARASSVGKYVIFNIRHNEYRLLTIIHYCRLIEGRITNGPVYIRSFLTHKEYDDKKNWDRGVRK